MQPEPDGSCKPQPTVLVFWSVENSARCVDVIDRNVAILSKYPSVSFAISHFDGQSDRWAGLAWYAGARVVYRSVDRGTKTFQWKRLRPELVAAYDYVWLCDSDLGFERVDMGLVLRVLSTEGVWYCQPSIVGVTPESRSTDIQHLRYDASKPAVEWLHDRTEVQAPILNTNAWPIIHEQVCLADDRSVWGIDSFWDELFRHKQGRAFPLIHTPLVHHDFRNVTANGAVRAYIEIPPIPDKAARLARFRDEHELLTPHDQLIPRRFARAGAGEPHA